MALGSFQATVTDAAGNVVAYPNIQVWREIAGAPLATLFADFEGETPLSNPFTPVSGDGYFRFHAVGGFYRVRASGNGFVREWRYVAIGVGAGSDILSLVPKGAWDDGVAYSAGDFVSHGGYGFISLIDGNLNNEPDDTPSDTAEWWLSPALNAPLESTEDQARAGADSTTRMTPRRVNLIKQDMVAGMPALSLLKGDEGIAIDAIARAAAIRDSSGALSWLGSPDLLLTVSRGSVASYVDKDCILKYAPANTLRYDHDPVTGEPLGVLLEGARTNLFQRSEEFDSDYWSKIRASGSGNVIVAPDGALTADKIAEDDTASNTHRVQAGNVSYTSGSAYTFSLWAKAGERSWCAISLHLQSGGSVFPGGNPIAYFNLTTGALGTVANCTAAVTPFPEGWFRIHITATANATGNNGPCIWVANGNNGNSYSGDGSSGFYIWGAQLEVGSFPSSYIPTTSATVTQALDNLHLATSLLPMPSTLRLSLYSEFSRLTVPATPTAENLPGILQLSDGSAVNMLAQRVSSTQNANYVTGAGGVYDGIVNIGYTPGTIAKFASAITPTRMSACLNGGSVSQDIAFTAPNISLLTALNVGSQNGATRSLFGRLRRAAVIMRALTDAELQELSS